MPRPRKLFVSAGQRFGRAVVVDPEARSAEEEPMTTDLSDKTTPAVSQRDGHPAWRHALELGPVLTGVGTRPGRS